MSRTAPASPAHASPGSPLVAIGCALLAFLFFTGMDTTVKLVAERTSAVQAGFFNALFALLPMSLAVWRRGPGCLRTREIGLHALRGVAVIAGCVLTFFAYSRMPIADAYAVLFTMPLTITALSVPLLGEPVGWRRWAAILIGFSGVLVMLRPGSGMASLGSLAALAGCTCSAVGMVLLRLVQRSDSTEAAVAYGNLAIVLGLGLSLPFIFVQPSLVELGLSALGGLLSGLAFLLLGAAYARAPAAVVAPFQYSQMPLGLLSGFLLYGTVPDPWMLLGASIVIASGFFILHREAAQHRLATAASAARPLRAAGPIAASATRPAAP